jgi:hypothetical protein
MITTRLVYDIVQFTLYKTVKAVPEMIRSEPRWQTYPGLSLNIPLKMYCHLATLQTTVKGP